MTGTARHNLGALLPTSSQLSLEAVLAGLGLNQHRSGIQRLDPASE
jgi:hypothetical protein